MDELPPTHFLYSTKFPRPSSNPQIPSQVLFAKRLTKIDAARPFQLKLSFFITGEAPTPEGKDSDTQQAEQETLKSRLQELDSEFLREENRQRKDEISKERDNLSSRLADIAHEGENIDAERKKSSIPAKSHKRRIHTRDLEKALGEQLLDRRHTVIYVCGTPGMTDWAVKWFLGRKGMTQERVLCEKWW